ncbi:hypothetical protein N7533_005288 [Penicillium manginii]|jgi:hypothetical protein|uniref:uncharacterized protein n=1 Tax=Penicillium manginii TaxID=203109 RepID=UPI0025481088|nr:uncharacterized protein N7533_005288 [Penicillium manginii]KAJ5755745.1 hypothetical protein N7533_005288 [Penicillium manginii]
MTTVNPAQPSLTSNDAAVLQALFDAESSPSSGVTIESTRPSWPATVNISETDLASLKTREADIIRKVQGDEPSQEVVKSALDNIDNLLREYPSYPPAYTNRAQMLRLLIDLQYKQSHPEARSESSDDALFTPEADSFSSQIFTDLGKAITLATPASPADSLSTVQARLLADAHTHRGYLLLKAARVLKNGTLLSEGVVVPERLRGLDADELEEMASRDFFLGGRFGNKVAQQLAVQTNPYAKMCGAIVKEAMRKEVEGGQDCT